MKTRHFFFWIAIIAVLVTACKKDVEVASVTLNTNALALSVCCTTKNSRAI